MNEQKYDKKSYYCRITKFILKTMNKFGKHVTLQGTPKLLSVGKSQVKDIKLKNSKLPALSYIRSLQINYPSWDLTSVLVYANLFTLNCVKSLAYGNTFEFTPGFLIRYMRLFREWKGCVRISPLTGFEPTTFGSGVRRSTPRPRLFPQVMYLVTLQRHVPDCL